MKGWGVLCTLTLIGCANMSGLDGDAKYACAVPDGVACDSVSGTYANALRHNLPSQRSTAAPLAPRSSAADVQGVAPSPAEGSPQPPRVGDLLPAAATRGADQPPPDTTGIALRSPARVLRLWTKPWEDADGDLWDQGYVYVQVDAGRWQLDHMQQRIRDLHAPLRPPPTAAPSAATPPRNAGTQDMPTRDEPESHAPANPFGNYPAFNSAPTSQVPRKQ